MGAMMPEIDQILKELLEKNQELEMVFQSSHDEIFVTKRFRNGRKKDRCL